MLNPKLISYIPLEIELYVTLVILTAAIIPSSLEAKVLVAFFLPFVLTYSSGRFYVEILGSRWFKESDVTSRIFYYALLGITINSAAFIVFGFLGLFQYWFLIVYFFGISLLYSYKRGIKNLTTIKQIGINPKILIPITSIFLLCLVLVALAIWIQPPESFPHMVGWDVYNNMLTVRTILLENGIAELNLRYLPAINYFYAAEALLLDIDPYYLYWQSIYFVIPTGGICLYILGKKLSRSELVAVSTSIFGMTIGSSNETLGFIFPYASTYGLLITILANSILLSKPEKKYFFLYIFSVIMIYPYALVANFLILVGCFFKYTRAKTYYSVLLFSSIVFVLCLYFGGSILGVSDGGMFTLNFMLSRLGAAYANGQLLALVFLGGFYLWHNHQFRNRSIQLIIINTAVLFFISTSGLYSLGYRLEEYFRPFVAFIIGYGIGSVCLTISQMVIGRIKVKK